MSVMPKCEKCGRYFILSDGGPCNCEVKLRLAIRDLYRGDGGPLNDYNQGWNDGVEAAMKALSSERDAAVDALKAARKALSYCAVNPMELHPSNNSQHIVASNALGDLDAAIDAARKDAK